MPLVSLILPILSAVAPSLVKAVAGDDENAQVISRTVRDVVAEVTGVAVTTAEERDEALRRIREDAELRAELKLRLADIALRETEALLADRADARRRDVELTRVTGRVNDRATNMLIAAFAAVAVITVALIVLNFYVSAENDRYIGAVIGFLTGVGGMFARNIGTAFDFEFGSSRGSQIKSSQIEALSAQIARAPEAPLEAFRRRLAAS
ncbi:hypothetical protein [Oceanicella actignis]|uniref:Holin of 3TMs, for gene-transfer release n=1 Tax=Oceanicella actignis TaxID=1189325 RepID=A0A1M7TS57_9RHOB|nr:hypothetical protein [Oceanicella actignis]SET77069.1 hypothetical protein SAMN04488119_10959 [Oceanicella actignis]SHN73567.1 hypothetical protein SAMN05216200_10963 [Oceanicella actignis]